MSIPSNVDLDEVRRFSAISDFWWDEDGPMAALHRINPVRISFILEGICKHFRRNPNENQPLSGLKILDIGCGAGLLCEPLTRLGASVSGIDAAKESIMAAVKHANEANLNINYQHSVVEEIYNESWDIVLAMEVIEHVPNIDKFVTDAIKLVNKGGLFFGATINRTIPALLLGIGLAEYILSWVPRGTHKWQNFVKPSEFSSSLRKANFDITNLTGVTFNLSTSEWIKSTNSSINYMIQASDRE